MLRYTHWVTTIKVSVPTRDRVKALGEQTHETAEQVVSHALDEYERMLFWRAFGAAAQGVAVNSDAAAEEADEQQLWDRTLRDGLERA